MSRKDFITYEQMFEKVVQKYGLIVDDYQEFSRIIRDYSYYDLINGYKPCLMHVDDQRFRKGISISLLEDYLLFDNAFQTLLLRFVIFAEKRFKNALSYIIAKEFGVDVDQYLDPTKYDQRFSTSEDQRRFKTAIKNMINVSKNENAGKPTTHYQQHHDHIPPWILFRNCRLGDCITLYIALKPTEKEFVAGELVSLDCSMETKKSLLSNGLHLLKNYRNIFAHDTKYVGERSNSSIPFPKDLKFGSEFSTLQKSLLETTKGNDTSALLLLLTIILGKKVREIMIADIFEHFMLSSKQYLADPTHLTLYLDSIGLESATFLILLDAGESIWRSTRVLDE